MDGILWESTSQGVKNYLLTSLNVYLIYRIKI